MRTTDELDLNITQPVIRQKLVILMWYSVFKKVRQVHDERSLGCLPLMLPLCQLIEDYALTNSDISRYSI